MRKRGYHCVAGVDEAGRGPLAGPVGVAAVILPDGFRHKLLTDSKQLTEEQREDIYGELTQNERVHWHVVLVDVDEIDRIIIRQATYLGMHRAVAGLSPPPEAVLSAGRPVPGFP
jgi:ribonuclease HII